MIFWKWPLMFASLVLLMQPDSASATPVTWTASGRASVDFLTDLNWSVYGGLPSEFSGLTDWTLTIMVDSEAVDELPLIDTLGHFSASGTLSFAGLEYSYSGGFLDIRDSPGFDAFTPRTLVSSGAVWSGPLLNGLSITGVLLQPHDIDGTIFSSSAIPVAGPEISEFDNLASSSVVGVFFTTPGGGSFGAFNATFDELSRSPIPEPSTAVLFGLGILGFASREKQRSAVDGRL